jgi:hypothetical protein
MHNEGYKGEEEPSAHTTKGEQMNRHTDPRYDYEHQAWTSQEPDDVRRYVACGHPESMQCRCYGTIHRGQSVSKSVLIKIAEYERENEAMRR